MSNSSHNVDTLTALAEVLEQRKTADPAKSYVARLHQDGADTMLQKVGEEAVEFLLAGKNSDSEHLVAEAADVWFHMLVFLSHRGLGPDDILNELSRREGLSGLDEKAARPNASADPQGVNRQ